MQERIRDLWRALPRRARRIFAAAAGGSVVLVGLIMLVTPGPAIVVVPVGLSILALEFAWARRWIRKLVPDTWQPDFLRVREDAALRGGGPPTAPRAPGEHVG